MEFSARGVNCKDFPAFTITVVWQQFIHMAASDIMVFVTKSCQRLLWCQTFNEPEVDSAEDSLWSS